MLFKAGIYKDAAASSEYPWFFTVEYVPRRDDAYEYGSVATFREAITAVEQIMRDGTGKPQLTLVPGATPVYDNDGNEIVDVATCGHCGRSWNDAAISSLTPAPSARCPFEYEHEEE